MLFAVDPVREIADEALELGAQLIVTHHPLYLRGTTTVAADTFKGRVVHTLIKHDIALHVAHTNADTADPGVSDALAGALDLRITGPLVPDPTDPEGGADSAGSANWTTPRPWPPSPPAPPPGSPPPRRASGWPATRRRICAPSPSAAAPATASSTPCAPRASTPSSPPTCATTRPPRPCSTRRSASSTPRTGPPSGPGEQAAAQLDALSDRHGWDLRVHVSKQVTDPWTTHHSSGAPN